MSNETPVWRIGEHYAIHVYEGERPVATFHTVADAKRAVQAVNAAVGLPTTDEPTREPQKLCEHGWNRAHNELVGPGQLTKVPCPGLTDDERPAKDER